MAEEILTIPIKDTREKDKVMWTRTEAGIFTVKSAYNQIWESENKQNTTQPSSSYQHPKELWGTIWNMQTHEKIKTFILTLCRNAIPTPENLGKRKIISEPVCPLCRQGPKTIEHIFRLCKWTKGIWRHPDLQVEITEQGLDHFEIWLLNQVRRTGNSPSSERLASVLKEMWKEQGTILFLKHEFLSRRR